jgi:hypothetical protein
MEGERERDGVGWGGGGSDAYIHTYRLPGFDVSLYKSLTKCLKLRDVRWRDIPWPKQVAT